MISFRMPPAKCNLCGKEIDENCQDYHAIRRKGYCVKCAKEITDWGKYLFENREKIKKLLEEI